MSKEKFLEIVSKLRLLNPQADIGTSPKTTTAIWSEIEAKDLTLPPEVKLYSHNAIQFEECHRVEVLHFGEHPELQ